jgi:hypothetical protein
MADEDLFPIDPNVCFEAIAALRPTGKATLISSGFCKLRWNALPPSRNFDDQG